MFKFARTFAPLALALGTAGALGVAATPSVAFATEVGETGQFHGGENARGTAEIVSLPGGGHGIKLHGNFSVTPAPDLRVYLSDAANPSNAGAVNAAHYVDLGALTSANGEQVYAIPASVNLGNASSVVIWCREFSVFFGVAPLS